MVKLGSNGMADYSTLVFARNLFHVAHGSRHFCATDFFNRIGFAQRQTRFQQLTGHMETGIAADPWFAATTGTTLLTLVAGSPAIDAAAAAAAWVPDDLSGNPDPPARPSILAPMSPVQSIATFAPVSGPSPDRAGHRCRTCALAP